MKGSARTVLLWVLIWYGVVQLFPLLLKDRWTTIGPYTEKLKWPALQRLTADHPERPLLLMLGSSRTCYALQAAALDGMPDRDGRPLHVFNFGIPAAGGPIHQLFYLRDILAAGIRPRLVLIEILPPMLCVNQRGSVCEEDITGFEWVSARRLWQWYPYLRRHGKRLHAWLDARIAPWYAFRRQLHFELQLLLAGMTLPTYEPLDEWGWHIASAMLPPAERQRRFEEVCAGYGAALQNYRLGKKPTKALYELLDLCRQEKIAPVLVVMPESSAVRSWYSADGKKQIQRLLEELSRAYDAPVIDANCWVADDDFEDGHHTLLKGAQDFTSLLKAELPPLLAQSKTLKSD